VLKATDTGIIHEKLFPRTTSAHVIPTASDPINSCFDITVKYEILTKTYIIVTSGSDIKIANGKFFFGFLISSVTKFRLFQPSNAHKPPIVNKY
jgi:hypothetical protein